jgi:hypothetical protein
MMNQEKFERLRLLVIQHGTKEDVDALHDFRVSFNRIAGLVADPDVQNWPEKVDGGFMKLLEIRNLLTELSRAPNVGCAKCGAAVHSDDPRPGDWCMDCNMAFSPSENSFANNGKRIRAVQDGKPIYETTTERGWKV